MCLTPLLHFVLKIIQPPARMVPKRRKQTMNTITDLFATGVDQVRKSWSWFLVLGIFW